MARPSYVLLFIYATGFIAGTFADWQDEYTAILNEENNKDFLNTYNKLTLNFQAYNFDDDRAMPWKELKESMEAIQKLLNYNNYNGAAESALIDVQETTAKLINKYRTTTGKMFRWAIAARENIYFLIRRKDQLKSMARIKQFTQNLLDDGKLNIQQTIDALNEISESLITLEFNLKRMFSTLISEYTDRFKVAHTKKFVFPSMCTTRSSHVAIENICQQRRDQKTLYGLIHSVDGRLGQIGTIRSYLVEKVTKTRSAMEADVNYLEELNGKAIELAGRSNLIPVDIYELIFEDLENFASHLNDYVTRHGGGATKMAASPQLAVATDATLEMEFLQMTNDVKAYVDQLEFELYEIPT